MIVIFELGITDPVSGFWIEMAGDVPGELEGTAVEVEVGVAVDETVGEPELGTAALEVGVGVVETGTDAVAEFDAGGVVGLV